MVTNPSWVTRAVDTISSISLWETSAHFYTTMPEAQAKKLNNALINQQHIPSAFTSIAKEKAKTIKLDNAIIKAKYSHLIADQASDVPSSTIMIKSGAESFNSSMGRASTTGKKIDNDSNIKHKIAGIEVATTHNNKLTDGSVIIVARKEKDIEFYKPVIALKSAKDRNLQWDVSWQRIIYNPAESLNEPDPHAANSFPDHSEVTTVQTVPGSGDRIPTHAHDQLIDTLVDGGYEVGFVRVKIDKPKPFIKKTINKINPFSKTKETLAMKMPERASGNSTPVQSGENTPIAEASLTKLGDLPANDRVGNDAILDLADKLKANTAGSTEKPRSKLNATTELNSNIQVSLEEIGWKGTAAVAKDEEISKTQTLEKLNRLQSGKPIFMEERLGRIPALGRVVLNNKKWVVGGTIVSLTVAIPSAIASNKSKEAELKEETIGGLEKRKTKLETDLQDAIREKDDEKRKRQAAETDLKNSKNQQTENRRQDALNEGRRNGASGSSDSTPSSSGGLTLAGNRTNVSASQSNLINGADASPPAEAKHLPGSLGSAQAKPTASSGKQPQQSASSLTQLLSQSAPWQRRAVG